jgi:hypothetical protein
MEGEFYQLTISKRKARCARPETEMDDIEKSGSITRFGDGRTSSQIYYLCFVQVSVAPRRCGLKRESGENPEQSPLL